MRKIFVNLTAHKLLPEQIAEASKFASEIVNAEEVLPAELLQKLRNTPGDSQEIYKLAYQLADALVDYARKNNAKLYVHLPVGSPAFMWAFAEVFPHAYAVPVFSHSRREVVEVTNPDGSVVKKSGFRFEGYVTFENFAREAKEKESHIV